MKKEKRVFLNLIDDIYNDRDVTNIELKKRLLDYAIELQLNGNYEVVIMKVFTVLDDLPIRESAGRTSIQALLNFVQVELTRFNKPQFFGSGDGTDDLGLLRF